MKAQWLKLRIKNKTAMPGDLAVLDDGERETFLTWLEKNGEKYLAGAEVRRWLAASVDQAPPPEPEPPESEAMEPPVDQGTGKALALADMPEFLTQWEVMDALRISRSTFFRWMRDKKQREKIGAVKVGNLWRISRERLRAYLGV